MFLVDAALASMGERALLSHRPTTAQRDPPPYDDRDRSGRGEWRPADREWARVATGPYTPDGGHAIGSKEPHGTP